MTDDDRPIETSEDEALPVTLASLSERTKVFEMLAMPERLARAERALHRAGYTFLEGAAEWKPPLGARWSGADVCPETAPAPPAPPAVLPQDLIDADRWRMAESLYMGFDFSYQLADDKEVSVLLLKLPEGVGAGAALEMSIDALIAKAKEVHHD